MNGHTDLLFTCEYSCDMELSTHLVQFLVLCFHEKKSASDLPLLRPRYEDICTFRLIGALSGAPSVSPSFTPPLNGAKRQPENANHGTSTCYHSAHSATTWSDVTSGRPITERASSSVIVWRHVTLHQSCCVVAQSIGNCSRWIAQLFSVVPNADYFCYKKLM